MWLSHLHAIRVKITESHVLCFQSQVSKSGHSWAKSATVGWSGETSHQQSEECFPMMCSLYLSLGTVFPNFVLELLVRYRVFPCIMVSGLQFPEHQRVQTGAPQGNNQKTNTFVKWNELSCSHWKRLQIKLEICFFGKRKKKKRMRQQYWACISAEQSSGTTGGTYPL